MLTKSTFDDLIKKNLLEAHPSLQLGYYVSPNTKPYDFYYNNSDFFFFTTNMQCHYPHAYEAYAKGKGSELICHNGKPPKMASVASSSRFCYLALRDGADALGGHNSVCFEHACPIKGIKGTPPQLDAYVPDSNLYIEAKCHEIFDTHSDTLSTQYWSKFFSAENDFHLPEQPHPVEKTFIIPYDTFGLKEKPRRFDFKQFLCHLLGLPEYSTLVYLYFKPTTDDHILSSEIDHVFEELAAEINSVLQNPFIQHYCTKHFIHIRAVAEHSPIMEALSDRNMISL